MLKIPVLSLLVAAIGLVAGCSKNSNSTNQGCISRQVWKVSDVRLSPADYDTAVMLFNANQLSLETFQPIYAYHWPPDSQGVVSNAFNTLLYVNGLPLSFDIRTASFSNGKYTGGLLPLHAVPENNDTSATLSLGEISRLFYDSKPDTYTQNPNRMNQTAIHWNDSCLVAVLSYAYKNRIDENAPSSDTIVKVWTIYGSGSLLTPRAFITDPGKKAVPVYYLNAWP